MHFFSHGPVPGREQVRAKLERLGLRPDVVVADRNGTTVAIDATSGRTAVGHTGYLSVVELPAIADVIVKPGPVTTELRLVLRGRDEEALSLYFLDSGQARLAQLQLAITLVRWRALGNPDD
ncbi:MAG TPA: hypothetical protein VKA32_03230 [Gammaproteobacteria bacterium]|nr:hypothetical protein [Gammaproteobacteria bacterium]